jgi:hypothetical protein
MIGVIIFSATAFGDFAFFLFSGFEISFYY